MKFSLKAKILTAFLCVGLIPLSIVGSYSYLKSSQALEDESLAKLESIRSLKTKAVERYFKLIQSQVLTFSHNEGTISTFVGLSDAFNNYIADAGITAEEQLKLKDGLGKYYSVAYANEYQKQNDGKTVESSSILTALSNEQMMIQADYISENSNALGSKHLLGKTNRPGKYNAIHSLHHKDFVEYLQRFELYDIFLIDAKTGNVVYSVYKEVDFGTSLKTGPFASSGLGKAFAKAMEVTEKGVVVMNDYEPYRPSYDGPAGFVAAPIYVNGEKRGVVAFQVSFDKVNSITLEKTGNEKTLETFLVGSDFLMRSDAGADSKNRSVRSSFRHPETGSLKDEIVQKALKGESGSTVSVDYFGESTLVSYAPVEIIGNKWAIVSYYRTIEAFAPVERIKKALMYSVIIFVVFISAFALWFDRAVVSGLINSIAKVAEGLKKETSNLRDVSKSSLDLATKLSESTTEQAAGLQETVSSINEISAMVTRNADSAAASSQKTEESHRIAVSGKEKAQQMMESIAEISESNQEIVKQIEKSNLEFSEIVKVIQDIATKTQVINDIVFQTKLLSFNASVEAARAGENGKGFAVVAEEVGNLASMSGKAAMEITEMVTNSVKKVTEIVEKSKDLMDQSIKKSKDKIEFGTVTSKECMSALDEIYHNASAVNEMVREISTASKEQSSGVQEINKAMTEMDQVTQSNSHIAQDSSHTAKELQDQAERLDVLVKDLVRTLGSKETLEDRRELKRETKAPDNIISFSKPRPTASKTPAAEKKQKISSGIESEIPQSNDPRFEDV